MAIDEAWFRKRLMSELRRQTRCCEYLSSMNRAGVPDVHVVVDGRAFWLELKFTSKWPAREHSNTLDHRFSAPQLSFLRRVTAAGGMGMGVIGFRTDDGSSRTWVAAVDARDLADDGTVSRAALAGSLSLDLGDRDFGSAFLTLLARS
jgi:hypothetical protein